jgi:hypothetical protein
MSIVPSSTRIRKHVRVNTSWEEGRTMYGIQR